MNNYLFLTNEGYTYQPDSESIEPDCENAQLIGIAAGNTEEEAFILKHNRLAIVYES